MSQVSLLQISQSEHGLRLLMLMTRSRVGMSMAGLGGKELLVVAAHLKARPNEPKSCAQREAQAAVLASEGLDRVRAHMRQELVTEAFDPAEGGRTRWRGPRDRQVAESEEHSRVRDTADGGSDPDDSGESGDEEDGLEMQGRIERHKLCPDAAATEQARAMTAAATEQARAMAAAATAMTTHIQAVNAWYKMCVSAPAS